MKKTFLTIAVIAGTIAAASCQKESSKENLTSAPQFTATIEDGSSTKTTVERVAGPPATYKTYWESTDQISVNGAVYTASPKTDATKADFNYTSGTAPEAPYSAYYPATVYDGTTATLPASYTYAEGKYNMPMYAYNDATTSLSFKNLCGVLAITVPSSQITSVSSITVVSDKQLNGAFTANSEGILTFASKTLDAADKKVTLTFSEPMSIEDESGVTFYIPVPAGTHNPLTINVSNGTIMKTMVTKKSKGVEVERNTVYPIAFADNQPDMLPGVFSVSADKKVRFSKGNLYWDGSEWQLESDQYGCPSLEEFDAGHIGHLYWTKTEAASYEVYYDDGECSETDKFFCDGSDAAHTLTVDGQSGLYALTKDEWEYLIDGRTDDASSLIKAEVTVAEVNCLIIAPDGYTGEIADEYTLEEWLDAQSQGLVCLPYAESRTGEVINPNECGYYWASYTDANDIAHVLWIDGGNCEVTNQERSYGFSVRLVSSVQ